MAEHGTVILVAEPGIDCGLEPGEGGPRQPKVHAAAAGATTVPSSRVPSRSNTTAFGRIRAAPSLLIVPGPALFGHFRQMALVGK